MKTVVKILHGSHLYGTNTPNSDTDYKTIFIPEAKSLILQKAEKNLRETTGKPHEKNNKDDVDAGYFSLDSYFNLLEQGQTVALDLLFAPDANIIKSSPLWRYIQQNRYRLVHKKAVAFIGYCKTQANKYGIKGSRMAAVKSTLEYLLLKDKNAKLSDIWPSMQTDLWNVEHVNFTSQLVNTDGTDRQINYLEVCGRKFDRACKISYVIEALDKIYDNYGARAQLAMTNQGIDWKALSHAVRVCVQGTELLKTGKMTLPLPEPELSIVKDIKAGKVPYPDVQHMIESYVEHIEEESKLSTLPEGIDREFCDELITNVYMLHMMKDFRSSLDNEFVVKWLLENR